jgi:SulP family sulfate permease
MILFPIGENIFSTLGPDGLSMFYVSCIISQLVYSCGGSVFKGGIGSEMVWIFFNLLSNVYLYRMLITVDRSGPFLSQNGIHYFG